MSLSKVVFSSVKTPTLKLGPHVCCFLKKASIFVTVWFLILSSASLNAGKVDWDGGGDNVAWGDEDNWKKDKLPEVDDDAKFKNGLNSETNLLVDLGGDIIEIKKIEVDTEGTVSFQNGEFNVSDELKFKGGGTTVLNVAQISNADVKVEKQ